MIVNTLRLMARIQAGFRTGDEDIEACAESCMSFLALHLRDDTVSLPTVLVPIYERLPEV